MPPDLGSGWAVRLPNRRKVAKPKPSCPPFPGIPSVFGELFRQERAGEPAPGQGFVGHEDVEAARELWKPGHDRSDRSEALGERGSPFRLVEVAGEGGEGSAPLTRAR